MTVRVERRAKRVNKIKRVCRYLNVGPLANKCGGRNVAQFRAGELKY
jgi:hypothetical protein